MARSIVMIMAAAIALLIGCEQKREPFVPADPEWVEVGEKRTTFYADPFNVYRKGHQVKMWHLRDHKTAQHSELTNENEPYLSVRSQVEYDCKEQRRRTLSFTLFSDNMGTGKVLYSDADEGDWGPSGEGSISQKFWDLACKNNH